ncbi:MAG TPA: hypothetical protein VHK04_00815, partial [Castellaniella sp.]|nr:hypothetical protein [Castellaniella sp.]
HDRRKLTVAIPEAHFAHRNLWPFATQEQSKIVLTNTASIGPGGDAGGRFATIHDFRLRKARFFIANGVVPQDPSALRRLPISNEP